MVAITELDLDKFTPVMQQYLRARLKLGDKAILLFRMGDFYEAFFDDAELLARELDITLTGRADTTHPNGRIPMAGVPAKAVGPYVARLLEKSYKVAIAEQMADPKTCKGLVPREITKIYTPGTIDDIDLLTSYQNNFIAAVYAPKNDALSALTSNKEIDYGLAYTDISTGEFYYTQVRSSQLAQELTRISPAEILIPAIKAQREDKQIVAEELPLLNIEGNNKSFSTNFEYHNFDYKLAEKNLTEVFKLQSLDSCSPDIFKLGLQAAGGIIAYLKETYSVTENVAFTNNNASAPPRKELKWANFCNIKSYQVSEYMMIDASTRRNLELTVSQSTGTTRGSLFEAINRCSSNLGKRRLKAWIEQPLYNQQAIEQRLDAVSSLISADTIRDDLSQALDQVFDIERLANRLASESSNAKELVSLKSSLIQAMEVSRLVTNHLEMVTSDTASQYLIALRAIPTEIPEIINKIDAAIVDEPPIAITEGKIIKQAYNQELDDYISLAEDSEAWLRNFETTERERHGIKNLKVNFNKVHGYFIEISKGNLHLVPDEYHCKQTMINNSRYITEELKEFEEKINNAESRRNGLEHKLFTKLRCTLAQQADIVKRLAAQIADLDALLSLAKVAIEHNYCRPQFYESINFEDTKTQKTPKLYIKEGRHPVIEQKLGFGEFVSNDIDLNEQERVIVLTGPNMAGKSTYMRQNALIILLAQIGSYVPATECKLNLVDRIFTRIGASDDLASGQSTFMVEMNETAAILNGMTANSFIVLDEIGRGTSTYDGVSIAWSVIEYIAKNDKARTIFATHYHELADLEHLYPCIANHQMLVAEGTNLEFLHKVGTGAASESYGIEVAKLAGLPGEVLSRAQSINSQLQSSKIKVASQKAKAKADIKKAMTEDGDIDISKLPLFAN